ncbi:MAG: hypothetical protein HY039_06340 [Nitrospirae bacterium]|nr:hypothetical protein [Nitrospirota bacterium]
MIITYSRKGVPIRISQERWRHISLRHPEMLGQKEKVVETIADPDMILLGDFSEVLAVRFYPETPLTRKHLIVAYKEASDEDGFVITAYFTNAPSKRRVIIWKR